MKDALDALYQRPTPSSSTRRSPVPDPPEGVATYECQALINLTDDEGWDETRRGCGSQKESLPWEIVPTCHGTPMRLLTYDWTRNPR